MSNVEERIETNLQFLRMELANFIDFFKREFDADVMVYDLWNVRDILGHITFWHESFARNISDLGKGLSPNPLKGKLSEVNMQSVETTRSASTEELIGRLRNAQKVIEKHIFKQSIDLIPYKRGSRDYSREEHLEIVAKHIHKHLKDIYAKTKK